MQTKFMKLLKKLTLTVVVLSCFTVNAFALDASEAVTVIPLLKTSTSWDGQALAYPPGKADITTLRVEIAPGTETGWHTHSVPSFAVMLEGSLEVRLKDSRVKQLQAGDVLAEVVDTLHNGRNAGEVPVKLVVFYAGVEGQENSAKGRW